LPITDLFLSFRSPSPLACTDHDYECKYGRRNLVVIKRITISRNQASRRVDCTMVLRKYAYMTNAAGQQFFFPTN
jgi:hypothetical protein